MIRNLGEFIANSNILTEIYPSGLPAGPAVVRSINLSRRGPTVVVRLDMPEFPASPRPEWLEIGCDRIQCHVAFLNVADFQLERWVGAGEAETAVKPLEPRRLSVSLEGSTIRCGFTSSDSLTVRHVSAYRSSEGQGRQLFASPLDRRGFANELPWIDERNFYG
jgi:hypothetical protein